MRITISGLGYLGIIQAVSMAQLGHHVLAMDIDKARVDSLTQGIVPISEPDVQHLWTRHLATGNIIVTNNAPDIASWSQVHFICVGAPVNDAGKVELSHVYEAVEMLALNFAPESEHFIIGKTTVPPQTPEGLLRVARREAPEAYVDVAWNPEFLRKGTAMNDSLYPDRHVFGVNNHRAQMVLEEVYKECRSLNGIIVTDPKTAALSKLAANAFIATKISFINSFSDLAHQVHADITDVSKILRTDQRIGKGGLTPGLGYGGNLSEDMQILMDVCTTHKSFPLNRFLRQVQSVNLLRTEAVRELAYNIMGSFKDQKITILGASYKPGTDDTRDSQALYLALNLAEAGCEVTVCDPIVKELPGEIKDLAQHATGSIAFIPNAMYSLGWCDLAILATEHPEYAKIDPLQLPTGTIIDARFALDQERWQNAGWKVYNI